MGSIMDEQKQAKHQALLDSAYALFLEQGGTVKASISEIAQRAGVAKGTFYLYFRDKENIVQALNNRISYQILREAYAHMDAHRTPEFAENVILLLDYIVEFFKRNPLVLRVVERRFSWPNIRSELAKRTDPMFERMMTDIKASPAFANRNEEEIFKMVFIILELCGTVCYSAIIENSPDNIDAMKPLLYEIIRKSLQA